MPQVAVEHQSRIKPKHYALGGVVLAVLMAAGVVALSAWYFAIPTPAKAVEEAMKLNQSAHYSQAEAILKRSQTRARSTEDKVMLLQMLASTATNENKLSDALDYYTQADKLQPGTFSIELNAAELAVRMGRKSDAIAWYTKVKDTLTKHPQTGIVQETSESVEGLIEELKK